MCAYVYADSKFAQDMTVRLSEIAPVFVQSLGYWAAPTPESRDFRGAHRSSSVVAPL